MCGGAHFRLSRSVPEIHITGGWDVNTVPTERALLSYLPCNKWFDQPFLAVCPVFITFRKHQQQTDGVLLSKVKVSPVCLNVSVWVSYEPKSKLSEAIAIENVLLQVRPLLLLIVL